MRNLLATLLVAILCPATMAQARTLVVDQSGRTGTFRDTQEAVDAARNGDRVLLVEPRSGATVDGKAIWLVGFSPQTELPGALVISNPPPGKVVGVSALKFLGQQCEVRGNTLGTVVFERCHFVPIISTAPSVSVEDFSGNLMFQSCLLRAAPAALLESAPALYLKNADLVTLNDCTLVGGKGLSRFSLWSMGTAGPGGAAAELDASTLRLQNTRLTGGEGGTWTFVDWSQITGAGGPGITATRSQIMASGPVLHGYSISAGLGQNSSFSVLLRASKLELSNVLTGTIGKDASSTITNVAPSLPTVELATAFLFGRDARIRMTGKPNSLGIVILSHGVRRIDLPFGTLFVDLTTWTHTLPTVLNGIGFATIVTPVGSDPSTLGRTLFCQGVEISSTSEIRLSTALSGIVSLH